MKDEEKTLAMMQSHVVEYRNNAQARAKTYSPNKGQKRKTDKVELEQGMMTEHGHGLKR